LVLDVSIISITLSYINRKANYTLKNISTIIAPLFSILNTIKPIPPHLQLALTNSFEIEEIKKNTIVLKENEVCKNVWFIADGLMRSYHQIGEKETTSRIMFNNHIVISPGSFFKQTPSFESIETLRDCVVAVISFEKLQNIYENFPEFNYHTRIVTEDYFYKQEQRLYMLRKHDATVKYKYFLDNYSNFHYQIPHKFIASFINIAPETLSRIRSKMAKGI
jgi:CRP/FNR family transcriptional regulator, anaerobic regulatory protein